MRIYDFFKFCTAPVSSLVAKGVVTEVMVSTNTGVLVGLKLSDCLQTFYPRANLYSKGQEHKYNSAQTSLLLIIN